MNNRTNSNETDIFPKEDNKGKYEQEIQTNKDQNKENCNYNYQNNCGIVKYEKDKTDKNNCDIKYKNKSKVKNIFIFSK